MLEARSRRSSRRRRRCRRSRPSYEVVPRRIVPVDEGHLDKHVDHVRADPVVLRVRRRGVRRETYLADDVEEEGLLDLASLFRAS